MSSPGRHAGLISRLRIHVDDVRRLTAGLDEPALARRTDSGKWSLKELACHLWVVQDLFDGRIQTMLDEDNPRITPYADSDGDPAFLNRVAMPASDSLPAFFDSRARFCARLDALSPQSWDRPGLHPEYPHYSVRFQIEYMLHHEAHHLYQMYQRRAPFGPIPA